MIRISYDPVCSGDLVASRAAVPRLLRNSGRIMIHLRPGGLLALAFRPSPEHVQNLVYFIDNVSDR